MAWTANDPERGERMRRRWEREGKGKGKEDVRGGEGRD